MIYKITVCLVLVILLCSCGTNTSAPAVPLTPTSTLVMPSATPTLIPITPTATPTSTPLPSPTPTPLPTASPTPVPTWPHDFRLGAAVEDIPNRSDLMLSLGITWVTGRVRHGQENPKVAILISQAHSNGLRVLLNVTGDRQQVEDTAYQAEFASFLASLAQQGADGIEVWPEANMGSDFDTSDGVEPTQYAALLCAAYAAIKEANADTLVVSGAPSTFGSYKSCPSCTDLQWIQGVAQAGVDECMDFVGASYIMGATSPSAISGHPLGDIYPYYLWPTVERYYETFGGARPLALTSFGYFSPEGYGEELQNWHWGGDTTVADQAEWTAEAMRMSIESEKVGIIVFLNLDTSKGETGENTFHGYSLIRPDGTCPTCETLRELLIQQ